MKIAFDAKRVFNNFTGLGNYSRTTIDMLTKAHPECEYLLCTPKVVDNDVTAPYINKEHCRVVTPPSGVPRGLWRTFMQADLLKREGADVYLGLSNELPTGLHRADIRSVVTIHDVAFKTFTDMYHWHDRMIYDQKWRYACHNADTIIAISECTKRDIMRFYEVEDSKIRVVYQPVNQRYYTPMPHDVAWSVIDGCDGMRMALRGTTEYMLYVGSINSRKNLMGIVKAIQLMPLSSRLPLVIVGGGREYKKEVQAYISRQHLEPWIVWAPRVDDHVLQALYTCARVFVYPSFYEGFGLPVVEALLCGCPVVTSNVSSLPEAGGECSLHADPNSAEDISEKICRAIEDDALRKSMIAGGYDYAMQTFHPDILVGQLWDVLTKG